MHDQRGLHGVVGLRAHEILHRRGGADHHDAARVGGLQGGHGCLDGIGGAENVDVQVGPPAVLVHLAAAGAHVGYQDIDAAQFAGGAGHPLLQRGLVGHIHGSADRLAGFRQFADRALHFFRVAGADSDVRALCHHQVGDGSADAFRAAGNDNFLAAESKIHGAFLMFL